MYRCEPIAIFLWLSVAIIFLYFVVRAIKGGEIFCNFVSFNKDGSYSFFIDRHQSPIAFWAQVAIDIVLISIVGLLTYPSAYTCVSSALS